MTGGMFLPSVSKLRSLTVAALWCDSRLCHRKIQVPEQLNYSYNFDIIVDNVFVFCNITDD